VARRPSDRKALVEYIEATANLQETDWLEWKSGYDLTTSTGRAATARQIIGFANRMPDQALRHADGYAYLVLGVEAGQFHGMPVHDSADIENWLQPYVGDDIVYDVDYVNAGGVETLFITIDPPQWGDDIHRLRKESQDEYGKHMRNGTVYVRKSGKTEVANSDDLDRLTARARRQGATLDLTVETGGPLVAPAREAFSDETRDAHLRERRYAMLDGVPEGDTSFPGYYVHGETRRPADFREQVASWEKRTREAWPVYALVQSVLNNPQELTFTVVNGTDDNFEAVQLEVTVPLPAMFVLATAEAIREHAKLPQPPARWGRQRDDLLRSVQLAGAGLALGGPDIETVAEKTTLVRFRPIQVRPKSRHSAGSVVLTLLPKMAGEQLVLPWRVTSTSTRGDTDGILTVDIAPSSEDQATGAA
jgi:hypothetical protein